MFLTVEKCRKCAIIIKNVFFLMEGMNVKKKTLIRGLKKLINPKSATTKYIHYYKHLKLDEKAILLESQQGTGMQGNMFYMLRELVNNPAYKDYKLYLTCRYNVEEDFRALLRRNGMERVQLVPLFSRKHLKVMASAKYLANDNTFLPFFIKKDGQVYLNTWHGTPLKTLGKKIQNAMYGIGNAQKNFIMADYLLYPNRYTMEHMLEDYMMHNLAKGKVLLSGYPRNVAFFDEESAKNIREELELTEKTVYAFMPTWRGVVGGIDPKASTYVQYYLYEMDKRLTDDEILYVNIHPIAKKDVNFRFFKHIKEFPAEYETYEFLNIADCLITDYSSVFYDFAVSRKKCVLFTYDKEEYFADRGVYRSLDDLPFPQVNTVDELFTELRREKQYDDTAFLQEYCAYDHPNAAKDLCARFIFGTPASTIEEREVPNNGKENVVFFSGGLAKNGLTTSLFNLLANLDTEEKNYFITFRASAVKPHQEMLLQLPEGVNYIATKGKMNLNFFKKGLWMLVKMRKFPIGWMMKILKRDLQLELRRHYGTADIHTLVHFTGYDDSTLLKYSVFEKNSVVFVHSDKHQEVNVRKTQRKDMVEYSFNHFDKVAIVTEDIREHTAQFVKNKEKIKVSHNLIDYDGIVERGGKELKFDDYTRCNIPFEQVQEIVNSSAKKIINVGRFSPEKGHRRLIDAFAKVWKDHPDTYLFIVGGYQYKGSYKQLCDYVETLPCADRIVLILSMSNPLPLVKACDGFVLSSLYEGFGLVLAEADILGVPVVSTDITGPRLFMQQYGGMLVPSSKPGIEQGIRKLLKGEVTPLTVDYHQYNQDAVNEFLALLK